MKKWRFRISVVIGLLAFAALIWFAGPIIGFGEVRPLSGFWTRFFIIFFVFALVIGIYGYKYYKRRKAEKALEDALSDSKDDEGDGEMLAERMSEAIETLRQSSGKRAFLYELPWYIIVGPPGAGKTTALVNSGLKFPLGSDNAAVAGVGGTRYCDWWFTEEAVMIDTAGRYTTQDSDEESDKKSWLSFLTLLKTHRAKQPINGVIVAISLEDIMTMDGQELDAHATAIRKRLLEIHSELKIEFPVYVLFTKADLIAGFTEYFGNFTESRRRKVWGATFQTQDRKKNMVGEIPTEFDALVRRLTEELPDRLQEEPDPISRISIFGFPAQFASLKDPIASFMQRIFEPTRYQANANLRGIYFSSGTQEGTPIDRVLGAMDRSFGDTGVPRHYSGQGRSYFLHDLLRKVIFAEAGWVSRDMSAVRRAAIFWYGSLTVISIITLGAIGIWGWSYYQNRVLIAATENSINEYRIIADNMLKSDTVSDVDVASTLEMLQKLRYMPSGYESRNEETPVSETFGLSQRSRLVSAAKTTYRHALERMFRSRLILRLERQIEASLNDPIVVYEALKVYLMLGGKAPKVDKELIVAWMQRDWKEDLYPGPNLRNTRIELEKHLRAMLALDVARRPSFELNGPLVENAQRALVRMNMGDRAYALIKSIANSTQLEDWNVVTRGGADTALVFETVDGSDIEQLSVPGLYTYNGFHQFFLTQLGAVAEKLVAEQWVMGELGEQDAVEEQFSTLGPAMLRRYRKEFIAEWEKVLANLKFRSMSNDKPQYVALSAASAPTSPIKQLFESIKDETALTRDAPEGGDDLLANVGSKTSGLGGDVAKIAARRIRDRAKGLSRIGIDLALKKSQRRAGSVLGGSGGSRKKVIPGANIEAYFKPYHTLVDGQSGRRPIDTLIQNFYEVYQSLVLAAVNPSQTQRANENLQIQVVNLRANASRLPRSLAKMVQSAVDDFEGDAAGSSISQLNQMLASTVTRSCSRVISNRYPFSRRSRRDVPMSDFARLFAPNGVLDRFFAQNLAPMADISGKTWKWKSDTRLGRELSKTAIKDFQRAAQIREAFFPTGGSAPGIQLTVTPNTISGDAEMALLNVNGTVIEARQVGNSPQTFMWPASGSSGSASISLVPELEGRKAQISFNGPWGFMRLLRAGNVSRRGDILNARFVIGGRGVSYKIQVGSISNPFSLPALAQFKCPTGL